MILFLDITYFSQVKNIRFHPKSDAFRGLFLPINQMRQLGVAFDLNSPYLASALRPLVQLINHNGDIFVLLMRFAKTESFQ